jgi:diguanylate cyclase (GGDEF)-like protein
MATDTQSSASPDRLEREIDALRESFRSRVPGRLDSLGERWRLLRGTAWTEDAVRSFHRDLHGLVGTSGSLGFRDASDTAREAEQLMDGWLRSGNCPDAEDRQRLDDLLRQIVARVEADDGPRWAAPSETPPAMVARPPRETARIVLVEGDDERADQLGQQLGHFGYSVTRVDSPEALPAVVARERPHAVVSEVVFAEGDLEGPETVRRLREVGSLDVPILFLSARSDVAARLAAVRAGCSAFFTPPVNPAAVVEVLDRLTRREPEPFRVLVVDDEAEAARYHALVLEGGGFQTLVVTEPLSVMSHLVEFRPDLILMDVYMPACSGIELAAVIRQQEAFVGVPIVYLSAERDRMRQIEAMGQGGDDFFTKPVDGPQLVAAAAVRAQRGRILRSSMERDGLTGLLNHSRTVERLEGEVRRARRSRLGLTLAMIDVDRFKAVNDTWGHLAGDQVLKSLAFLLRQRLRMTDLLGRFGGDEFTVILPETEIEAGHHLLDDIRVHFAGLDQIAGVDRFKASLSCGVASFQDGDTSQSLIAAADAAMYEAKRAGGNRLIVARQEA